MRDSNDSQQIPAICKALNDAIEEAGWSSRQLAKTLGIQDSAISRWRSGQHIPDRDVVFEIERLMLPDKLPGYVSRLAGYVEDPTSLVDILRNTPELTSAHRKVLLQMIEPLLVANN